MPRSPSRPSSTAPAGTGRRQVSSAQDRDRDQQQQNLRNGNNNNNNNNNNLAQTTNSPLRTEILSVEDLVAKFGENLVRRSATLHGAKFSELKTEGTLKALQADGLVVAGANATKGTKAEGSTGRSKRRNRQNDNNHDDDDEHDAQNNNNNNFQDTDQKNKNKNNNSPSPSQASNAMYQSAKPMSRSAFDEARKQAAWAVAEEECQRLLSVVQTECESQLQKEEDTEKAAAAAENRLDHLKSLHEDRMKREKTQFAHRLKHSVENTRSVMQRVQEDIAMRRRAQEEQARRQEEEEIAAADAFAKWQKDMKRRADEATKQAKEREEKAKKDRELQHWKESQAEYHQLELQYHAEEKRKKELSNKASVGTKRFDQAMTVRQQHRKEAATNIHEAAIDKLMEIEDQEKSAHDRWRSYQNYTKVRSMETSSHVNVVRNRAKKIEQERLQTAEERRQDEEKRTEEWRDRFKEQRDTKRDQFNSHRENEIEAYKRAEAAETVRKQKAQVMLEWLNARSMQQLRVLDQQRAVKQYEQHVVNAAMRRRADRAKQARELRNAQTQAEWSQKMDQGDERAQQRREMAKQARLEKEKLAVLAAKMKWQASTGQKVDMKQIDDVLRKVQRDATGEGRGRGSSSRENNNNNNHNNGGAVVVTRSQNNTREGARPYTSPHQPRNQLPTNINNNSNNNHDNYERPTTTSASNNKNPEPLDDHDGDERNVKKYSSKEEYSSDKSSEDEDEL